MDSKVGGSNPSGRATSPCIHSPFACILGYIGCINQEETMDLGAFGFWLFIAALVVAGYWKETRQNAEKHETLRRMIEKTGVIDEVKLKEVFSSATEQKSKPGSNYRGLRIAGTIIVFVGGALAIFFVAIGAIFEHERSHAMAALAVAVGVALLGVGVFVSSRFAEPPPESRNEPPAR